MKVDVLGGTEQARLAEDLGFDALYTDGPALALAAAAERTKRLGLGVLHATSRDVRWAGDLQEYSRGRLTLVFPGAIPAIGDSPYGRPKIFLRDPEAAGERADGLLLPARYHHDQVISAVERGLRRSGRGWDDLEVAARGIVITGSDARAWERSRRRALGREHLAVCGEPFEIPDLLVERYGAVCRRILIEAPLWDDPGAWAVIVARIHQLTSEPIPS